MSNGTDEQVDPNKRDSDLAYELFDVQPTHPEIGRLAHRVLAQDPWRSGLRVLLAEHRAACGAVDEAREILQSVLAQRDHAFVDAARELRDLEHRERDYVEAKRWSEVVLEEDQEYWRDWMMLGHTIGMLGDPVEGWELLDESVTLCANTDPDDLPAALAGRAYVMLATYAPVPRFIAAAEEAMAATQTNSTVTLTLIWAYVHQGRFEDAEQLSLRLLREDPTDEGPAIPLRMIRTMTAALEREGIDPSDVHHLGILDRIWTDQRDRLLGIDLALALQTLEELLPPPLASTLRPPVPEGGDDKGAHDDLVAWHDGQDPGADDQVVAPSMADFFWERVAAFGGHNPRPQHTAAAPADEPASA